MEILLMPFSESSMLKDIDHLLKSEKLSLVQSRQLENLVSGFMDDKHPASNNSDYEDFFSSRFERGEGCIYLSNNLSDAAIIEAVRKAIGRCNGANFTVCTSPEEFGNNS